MVFVFSVLPNPLFGHDRKVLYFVLLPPPCIKVVPSQTAWCGQHRLAWCQQLIEVGELGRGSERRPRNVFDRTATFSSGWRRWDPSYGLYLTHIKLLLKGNTSLVSATDSFDLEIASKHLLRTHVNSGCDFVLRVKVRHWLYLLDFDFFLLLPHIFNLYTIINNLRAYFYSSSPTKLFVKIEKLNFSRFRSNNW